MDDRKSARALRLQDMDRPVAPAVQGGAGVLACLAAWLYADPFVELRARVLGNALWAQLAHGLLGTLTVVALVAVWLYGQSRPHLARLGGLVGLALLFGPWLGVSLASPASVLLLLVTGITLAAWLLDALSMAPPGSPAPAGAERDAMRAVGGVSAAAVVWAGAVLAGASDGVARVAVMACMVTVSVTLRQRPDLGPTQRALNLAAIAAAVAGLLVGGPLVVAFLPALALLVATALWRPRDLVHRSPRHGAEVRGIARVLFDPALTMLATFCAGGVIGAMLLSIPEAAETGSAVSFVDALFTSFSAICVTGLAVVDTPTTYSALGEGVILVLIQVGGLGIMTLSAAALTFLGRRMSLRHEATVAELLRADDRGAMGSVLRRILVVTAASELAGAVVLTLLFWQHGDGLGEAAWRGLFTSISAFCNAGFALQTDSLVPYQGSPGVLLTIGALITVGGLGPLVVTESVTAWRRRKLSLQTRLVLWTSLALTASVAVLYLALEWQQTLAGMGFVDKLCNALFQSVTLRTAGFNSVDLAAVTPATYTLMLPMMFVGGSPGSTAGGIKTTTLAILALVLRAAFQGEERVAVANREVSTSTTHEAAAVAFVGVAAVGLVLVALLVTQPMPFGIALFETVSALGTVGLSIGGTGMLDVVGKVVVIVAMFAGRVGPLTLLVVLGRRERTRSAVGLPRAHIDIG